MPLRRAHSVWRPHAVASGKCKAATVEHLQQNLLPDGYTVLAVANSHVRQVVEALMCQFSDQVVSRNITMAHTTDPPGERQEIIGPDRQCRGTSTWGGPMLLRGGCVPKGDNQPFM